jgi:hypothetical protein
MKGSKKGSKTMHRRRQRGGQAPVNDSSMLSPSSSSLAQGVDYKQIHMGQHGGKNLLKGGAAPLESIGETLPQELQGPASVTSTMNAFRDIQGMSDQTGGARRKRRGSKRRGSKRRGTKRAKRRGSKRAKRRGSKRAKRRGSKRAKRRGTKRRGMKLYGGGANANPAAASAPGLILPSSVTEGGMNPEWSLAKDPQSFAPTMSGGNKMMYGGNKMMYGGNKMMYGGNKMMYGGNKMMYGGKRRTKRRKAKKFFGLF